MKKSRRNPLGLNEGNIRRMERHHAALAYHCAYIGNNRHAVIEGPRDPDNAIRTCCSLIPLDAPIFQKG